MLVAHESPQQLMRLQRAVRVRRDMVGVLVEVSVDAIHCLVFRIVVRLALLWRQIG